MGKLTIYKGLSLMVNHTEFAMLFISLEHLNLIFFWMLVFEFPIPQFIPKTNQQPL